MNFTEIRAWFDMNKETMNQSKEANKNKIKHPKQTLQGDAHSAANASSKVNIGWLKHGISKYRMVLFLCVANTHNQKKLSNG